MPIGTCRLCLAPTVAPGQPIHSGGILQSGAGGRPLTSFLPVACQYEASLRIITGRSPFADVQARLIRLEVRLQPDALHSPRERFS